MISPPRQRAPCSPKDISASAAIAELLHCARRPWILEHPCESWLWDVPKIRTLAAQLRTAWALAGLCVFGSSCRKRTLFLVGNVDSRDLHRIARRCARTGGRPSVTGQKHVHPKPSASRAFFCPSRDHTRRLRLSFALAMHGSHHERTTIPENTSLSGMGSSLVKGYWYGSLLTLRSLVEQNQ